MKKSYIYGLVSAAVGFFLSWLICILFFKKIESDFIKVFVTLAPALIGTIIGVYFIVKDSDLASAKEKKEHEKTNG